MINFDGKFESKKDVFALAQRLRESNEELEEVPPIELWSRMFEDNRELSDREQAELILAQQDIPPYLVSAVLEKTCNLQCLHCLYGAEKSSRGRSEKVNLVEIIEQVVKSMPEKTEDYSPSFMSVGRILQPWHLDLMARLRTVREDLKIGLIDNGTYTRLLDHRWPYGFKLDWIDISIDGTEETHNKQRASERAYSDALKGLEHARQIVLSPDEGGRVSTLLTLTKLNANEVVSVADKLLTTQEDGSKLADIFQVTTVSKTNETNAALELDVESMEAAWKGLVEASKKYNYPDVALDSQQVILKIYRSEDFESLAAVVGERRFLTAFSEEGDALWQGDTLYTTIDGVTVSYQPLSIWAPEEFLISPGGEYRVAYEGKYTEAEHQAGISREGEDISRYTVEALDLAEVNMTASFQKGVEHYWRHFGADHLKKEREMIKRIHERAQ